MHHGLMKTKQKFQKIHFFIILEHIDEIFNTTTSKPSKNQQWEDVITGDTKTRGAGRKRTRSGNEAIKLSLLGFA